jgi:hypothetical protein
VIDYKKALLNQRFHKLVVIGFVEINKWGQTVWKCKCDCGGETLALISPLRRGAKKSCGCLDSLKGKERKQWRGFEDLSLSRFNKLKSDAKKRNLEFSISIEEIWELFIEQKRKCALSGVELTFGTGKFDRSANASLDRIDSSKGYIKGNIHWVDKRINFMKQQFNVNEFRDLCKKVTEHRPLIQ